MSEIKRYNIFRYQNGPAEMEQDNDGDWVDYTDCVKLEQQKAELVELLTECYKRFKDYEMDVDTDRPIHHIRFMEKLQKYIITGGER